MVFKYANYNLRFPGQYYDAETGKHYNFNRDYNPVTGRYVQSDPIGLDGGMNGYGYVANNPFVFIDVKGLKLSWDYAFDQAMLNLISNSFKANILFNRLNWDGRDNQVKDQSFVPDLPWQTPSDHLTSLGTSTIYINTNKKYYYETENSVPWYKRWFSPATICTRASLERILVHEMAHLAYGITDENQVVQRWENPVMRELGINKDRTSYASSCSSLR